ncbi:MAG: T9SS type A sorting domain-containing protein [Bacteroidales bacterium]|nr:T9SS type A sorting domain-containing protein [Bacteroidales bacterium]
MKKVPLITCILIMTIPFFSHSQVIEQDSLALVAFYNSTGGPNWYDNSNWLTGPVNTWYGVTVEGDRVTELDIDHNNLQGYLPGDIGNLTALKGLFIGYEDGLTDSIPDEIGNLQFLIGLGIGNCSLTGTIPNTIGNCSKLEFINLWENNLTGSIPPEIGNLDSLQFLDLHDNQLNGPIPPEIGNCSNLWEIRLNDNQLTGTLPEAITLLDNLYILYLQNNLLSGILPTYVSNLFFQIEGISISLDLSDNNFAGAVPESWGDITFLIDAMNLSYNDFTSLPEVNNNWMMTFFNTEGNRFTFEDLESHYQAYEAGFYYYFYYYPQADMMEEIDTTLKAGSDYSIYSGSGGEFTIYTWYKDGTPFLEGLGYDTLYLENVTYADSGKYTCSIVNSLVHGLYLWREPVYINVDTTTGIQNDHNTNKQLTISPVPAGDQITVYCPQKQGEGFLTIYDMAGNCVISKNMISRDKQQFRVNISGLKSGIYILDLVLDNQHYSGKIIKNSRGTNR